ncbi:hypothetical protein [Filibacter tadaridae]|uniref:hypothetical protein n=1 Tax=Filibacter tadaridae TaxID=2483811 RepID=UPI000F53A0BC|nr:hypothetical protein [Filibacter tadaridae]
MHLTSTSKGSGRPYPGVVAFHDPAPTPSGSGHKPARTMRKKRRFVVLSYACRPYPGVVAIHDPAPTPSGSGHKPDRTMRKKRRFVVLSYACRPYPGVVAFHYYNLLEGWTC